MNGKEGKEGNGEKRALDAGVHLEVSARCFYGIGALCFLYFLLFFLFGFGGGDGHFGVDFGCAGFWLNVGRFGSGYVVSRRFGGGLRFGVEDIVGSLFGGEAVEFIWCGYDGCIFGVGRMGGGIK